MESASSGPNLWQRAVMGVGEFWHWLKTGCHDIKVASLTKFARWSDPKLAPYREDEKLVGSKQMNNDEKQTNGRVREYDHVQVERKDEELERKNQELGRKGFIITKRNNS